MKIIYDLNNILKPSLKHKTNLECQVEAINKLEKFRWDTLLTKEPETIEWIRNMNKSSKLLDLGANIGVYSLTAIVRGIDSVVAFEPYRENYLSLCRNIDKNNLKNIFPFNLAVGTTPKVLNFNQTECISGMAEFDQREFECFDNSTVLMLNINDLKPFPFSGITHLKIDVDGPEFDVLNACESILLSDSIESILVEVSLGNSDKLVEDKLLKLGFKKDIYYEEFRPHSIQRREKEISNNARNHVYIKN